MKESIIKKDSRDFIALKESVNRDNFIKFEVNEKPKTINLKLLAKEHKTPILIKSGEEEVMYIVNKDWNKNVEIKLKDKTKSFTIYGDITGFDCFDCYLTKLDVSNNKILEILICPLNEFGFVDVTKNINLKKLDCDANWLFELDVSNNINLEELRCEGNHIEYLDLSNCKNLKRLYSAMNDLKELDISNNSLLELIYISDNDLTKLDLSNNPKLRILECIQNSITKLDLSKNPKLESVDCCRNNFSIESAEALVKSLPMQTVFDKSKIALITIKKDDLEIKKDYLVKLEKLGKNKNWKVYYEVDDLKDDEFEIFPGIVVKKA